MTASLERKLARPRILVIDDNPEIGEALKISIGRMYDLILCQDLDCIERNLTDGISAVLLDIKMDFRNGVELFSILKKKRSDLPIIFHSAYPGSEATARKAAELPHSGYLVKGKYSRVELLETLAASVGSGS